MSKRSKILLALLILACVVGFVADQVRGQNEQIDNIDTIRVSRATEGWVLVYQMKDHRVLSIKGIEALVVAAEEGGD